MTTEQFPLEKQKLWSRKTSILLVAVGAALALLSLVVIVSLGPVRWHPARAVELHVTYDEYLKTGVLLVKPTGSGSPGTQAPTPGPIAAAAWDDDPGAYIVASLWGPILAPILGIKNPYPGLVLTEGLLVACAMLWLPTAVARVFRNRWAGFALILLPGVLWLTNHGALLTGTEYGLSDKTSPQPVYALYGMAASLAFLSLSLMLLLTTFRLRMTALVGLTVMFGLLAGFGNLSRSLSGVGVALCVGVLWWLNTTKRWRWLTAIAAAAIAVVLAIGVQNGVMAAINVGRVQATGLSASQIPSAHAVWHSVYLGLSYPGPITGKPSAFDVTWSDEFGWAQARKIDPKVVIDSAHYDNIMKGLYWKKFQSNPGGVVWLYIQKLGFVLWHFLPMIAVILAAFLVIFLRRSAPRKAMGVALAIAVPTLVLGLIPAVIVMPLLYYFSELSAALGLLLAVSVGAAAWFLTPHVARLFARLRHRAPAEATA